MLYAVCIHTHDNAKGEQGQSEAAHASQQPDSSSSSKIHPDPDERGHLRVGSWA
jgi:hypothetical protein